MIKVLALSSSRSGNGGFLEHALPFIPDFLGTHPLNISFVPFASVQRSYEAYGTMVTQRLSSLPYTITTLTPVNALDVLEKADAVMVGGGNTFKLLHDIYECRLFEPIKDRVMKGMPYIGWSAGANLTGRTIGTTNDMPIIEPESFTAFGFFPFQINPHYINQTLEGHNGETRDQRLEEFVLLNPDSPVVGLPEGTALRLENGVIRFVGDREGVVFRNVKGVIRREAVAGGVVLSS